MNEITPQYLNRAEIWMLITMLAYFLMNGAQLFETAVTVPKWSAKPPFSLAMLQGPYAPDLKTFWIVAHTLHEITFIVAIVCCWQLPQIKFPLLVIFVLHFAVRMWTIGYFAPNIIAFQKTDIEVTSDSLKAAVERWQMLNYIRVAAFLALSIAIAFLYCKVSGTGSFVASN